jgi:hypothetical protein
MRNPLIASSTIPRDLEAREGFNTVNEFSTSIRAVVCVLGTLCGFALSQLFGGGPRNPEAEGWHFAFDAVLVVGCLIAGVINGIRAIVHTVSPSKRSV